MQRSGWAGYAIERGVTGRSTAGVGMVAGLVLGGLAGAVGYKTATGAQALPASVA